MDRVRITVFDTTLRDGEQSPGCSMNVHEKLRMAHQLDRLGVDVIEAGFPIASDGDFEAVQAIAKVVRRPMIAGLARACPKDIERAWEALKGAARPRITMSVVPASSLSNARASRGSDYPYGSSREAVQGFERTTLSAVDREKIAHGNAERLLRIG